MVKPLICHGGVRFRPGGYMITQLHLENWKSYQKATLHIDALTVLIGTNASGKSNALDALLFLHRVASGALLTSALQGDSAQLPLRGGVEWAARKPGEAFSVGVRCRVDDLVDYEYRVEGVIRDNRCDLQGEHLVRIKYRVGKGGRGTEAGRINLYRTDACALDDPTIVARLYNEKSGTPRPFGRSSAVLFQLSGQKLRKEIEEGVAIVLRALRHIFLLDPIPSHMRGYSPLSEKLEADASNIAGVLAALPNDKKVEIEQTLTEYASQLPEKDIRRVYAETVGKFKSDAMLYCDELWVDDDTVSAVDARGMSDGTLRFLAILTALLTRPWGSLLVIEEIDNGLHPSRALLLLNMLRTIGEKRAVDVLATTHNPALLDAMGTEMVPFITVAHREPKTGYSVLTLLEDIGDLPKLLAQGTIGRLASKGLLEASLQTETDTEASA